MYDAPHYRGSGKLEDMAALITDGNSGIGRAVAVLFAREGADVAVAYLNEHEDVGGNEGRGGSGRGAMHSAARRCVRPGLLPKRRRVRSKKEPQGLGARGSSTH